MSDKSSANLFPCRMTIPMNLRKMHHVLKWSRKTSSRRIHAQEIKFANSTMGIGIQHRLVFLKGNRACGSSP